MAECHRVAAAAAGHAFELAVVLRDFRERNLRFDDDEIAGQHILALDPSAFGSQVARDIAHVLCGDGDFYIDDRLEQDGFCLVQSVDERTLARGTERDLFRVDGVMFAVIDRNGDVLHRETRDDAVLHDLVDSLEDGRLVLSGD